MHNCRETKEQITELLLDGADCRSDEVLAAELRGCAECRNEFEVLNATLRITTRLRETPAPVESYWTGYHARLRQRIVDWGNEFDAKAQRRDEKPGLSFASLRLFVRTAVPVPVPVIFAVFLAYAALGLFAILVARQPIAQTPTIVHVPVRVPVEVPVVQERIVTRVVYRERRTPKRIVNAPRVEGPFANSQRPSRADILAGFKPTEEVKLTVIKGGSTNEK